MSWPMVKLGDVVDIKGGGTPSKNNSEYWGGDIPWASVKDFKSSTLSQTADYITLEGVRNSATNIIPAGNVIIPTRMALGKVAINSIDMAINQDLKALIAIDNESLSTIYLMRFLESKASFINEQGKGATVKGITLDVLKGLYIPLPPLVEQKRIATILDKADAIRRKRQQAIQLADEFLRAVFLDMFGDPVTNPKGFEFRALSDFFVDEKNGTKCGPFGSALKKQEYKESGIPVWNMDNITLSGDFHDSPTLWVNEEKFEELKSYSVLPGDVIISRAGTVGKMGVVRSRYERSLISTNLIRVRFNEHALLPEYFVSLMTYCKGRVGRLKTGPDGAFTHMNAGILSSLKFPYPSIGLQTKFLEIRKRVISSLDTSLVSDHDLSSAFQSISQKAFAGTL